MSTLLEHPEAVQLLEQAQVDQARLRPCRGRLRCFIERYLPCFYRTEHRQHAQTILEGKLTDLQRKTVEPIAQQGQRPRRPLQHFVGAGLWSDETARSEMCRHVAEQIGDPDAVFVLDPSAFPKKGQQSCGVARQWCGRLGKKENCQVGVFLGYASCKGKTLLDAQLYLPEKRAQDQAHRDKTHVPAEVVFTKKWRIGLDLVLKRKDQLPHGWVCADDELGRVVAFRSALRLAQLRYVLDVPCHTNVRDLSDRRKVGGDSAKSCVPRWERADVWAARQPKKRWRRVRVKDGTKGPIEVDVLRQRVQTKDEDDRAGTAETLTVLRSVEPTPELWYTLSNDPDVSPATAARVHTSRHGIEELFEEGNQEIGLSHYEVRSWTGWAHHVTLSLLALWFLQLERIRLGKKKSSDDSGASARDLHRAVTSAEIEPGANCPEDQSSAGSQ